MSTEHATAAGADTAHGDAQRAETCRTPNCWRDAVPVRVADETERDAVLCEEHRRAFLGVSS